MGKKKGKFVIIDAMSLAYKGYFAFISRPLKTRTGESTSAVFGFVNQLLKIIEDTQPDYLIVAFDSKEKTFRHEMYDKYKSSREAMPEDMIPQIQRIKDVVTAFNIPIYIQPGYEADDLIGTAVKLAEKNGLDCYAVTPDKDYVQLITKNIKVIKPGKSTDEIIIIDEQKVKEDYGFNPDQMIDYLGLIGDSSDDIPGVKGIGPVTATPLISKYGNVETIYKNIDQIEKASVKNKLLAGKKDAFLSKKLATIALDVPLEFDINKARFEKPDFEKLLEIFKELEFKSFAAKVLKLFNSEKIDNTVNQPEPRDDYARMEKSSVKYQLITTEDEAKKLYERLSESPLFVFDTETDSLDPFAFRLAGVSFAVKPGEAFFIATDPHAEDHKLFESDLSNRLPVTSFVRIFKLLFENSEIKKVCQNGKFDISILSSLGIKVNNFYFDTMLASYVIDPDQKHGMDELSKKYLNYQPIPLSDLIGLKKDPGKIFEVDPKQLSDYSCEDADVTYHLYKVLDKEIKDHKLEKIAYDIEFPLVEVLEDMERSGVRIDREFLSSLSSDMQILLDNYTHKIFELAGEEFNINSTKQLQTILFDKLKLVPSKKTKTGFSTDARSLELLKGENEIIDVLLDYRQVSKLKSTYTDALPKLIHPKTGRVHTSFNQTVASTGRLSSLDPNLQNIPIRTELGKEIRKAFIPRDSNHVILSADYSQIELRIMASICEDDELMKAFKEGQDIHRSTAALVFMVDQKDVTDDMRRKAKEVNFGILYGIGPFGLKTRLGIPQTQAKEIIDTYFGTFKNVKNFMDDSIKRAKERGYAETLLGRRRYLPNINSNNRTIRQFEERVAINMPIQGTAADMIKLAMINLHRELVKNNLKSKMVLQVHDELVFDALKSEVNELRLMIIEIMANALPLKVPVVVDTGAGDNWLEAH